METADLYLLIRKLFAIMKKGEGKYRSSKNKKMTAKKMLRVAFLVLVMAITLPVSSTTIAPGSSLTNSSAKTENPRARQLLQRLEEIKGMNRSELTRLEKKNLHKEVKGIRNQMKKISGGVYLSAGAVIIIILLLILL
jgi:hypothetical protein